FRCSFSIPPPQPRDQRPDVDDRGEQNYPHDKHEQQAVTSLTPAAGSPRLLRSLGSDYARGFRDAVLARLDTIEGTVSFDPAGSHTGGIRPARFMKPAKSCPNSRYLCVSALSSSAVHCFSLCLIPSILSPHSPDEAVIFATRAAIQI